MAKKGSGLTPKKKSFARCVSGGMSLINSYKEAYNAENMSDASIRVEASRLMSDPNITLMIERLQAAADRAVIASTVSDADRVLSRLRVIVDEAEGTPAENTALRACDLLGKSVGLYRDVVETVVQRTPTEIRAELEALYAQHKDGPDQVELDQADKAVH